VNTAQQPTGVSATDQETDQGSLGVEHAVYIIRVASEEDLEIIHAAIRARAMHDAKEAAAKGTSAPASPPPVA
jgi:hypothetical protein